MLRGKALRPLGLSPRESRRGDWLGEVAGESMEASPGRPRDQGEEEEECREQKGGEALDPPDQENQETPGANATLPRVPPLSQGAGHTQEGTGGGPQAHMEGTGFTTHMRWSRCVRALGDSLMNVAPAPHMKMGHSSLHSRQHWERHQVRPGGL